ncbi:MAG TPA: hypothetical protein VNW04_05575 [Puia sp.]|jgi:hypothetical protein|nr:hypothetical protein [Puia sp.]
MGKCIHRFAFYTLILAVYGIFFSIQSFYNFEGHSDVREILRRSSLLRPASHGSQLKIAHAAYPESHKIRLRLNKRFHQEEFTPCTVYEVSAPVIYLTPRAPGSYPLCPLPAVTLFYPQLRGPPSVA